MFSTKKPVYVHMFCVNITFYTSSFVLNVYKIYIFCGENPQKYTCTPTTIIFNYDVTRHFLIATVTNKTATDFSILQITGEFENRFLTLFALRGHLSYGLRPASVNDNIGRSSEQPILHGWITFPRKICKIRIIIRIYASKKTGCQKRLNKTLTVMKVKTTVAQDCSNCNYSTC